MNQLCANFQLNYARCVNLPTRPMFPAFAPKFLGCRGLPGIAPFVVLGRARRMRRQRPSPPRRGCRCPTRTVATAISRATPTNSSSAMVGITDDRQEVCSAGRSHDRESALGQRQPRLARRGWHARGYRAGAAVVPSVQRRPVLRKRSPRTGCVFGPTSGTTTRAVHGIVRGCRRQATTRTSWATARSATRPIRRTSPCRHSPARPMSHGDCGRSSRHALVSPGRGQRQGAAFVITFCDRWWAAEPLNRTRRKQVREMDPK
jgi:hypothetical protein